jgi:hypothetical protein
VRHRVDRHPVGVIPGGDVRRSLGRAVDDGHRAGAPARGVGAAVSTFTG